VKALKYYLLDYRHKGIFYEATTNQIFDDLGAACAPKRMTVEGEFCRVTASRQRSRQRTRSERQRIACARRAPTPQAGTTRLRLATLSPRGGQGTTRASGKRRGAVGAIPASGCRGPTAAEPSLRRIFRVACRPPPTGRGATSDTLKSSPTSSIFETQYLVTQVTNVHRVPIEQSIDLHTFSPRDIPSVVDEYVRAAHDAGFREVRLIRRRGIGVQRARVHQVFRDHPLSFRLATRRKATWARW
jgi:hypothetical protein